MKFYYLLLLVLIFTHHNAFSQYVDKNKRQTKDSIQNTPKTTTPQSNTKIQPTETNKTQIKPKKSNDLAQQSFWQRLTIGGNFAYQGGSQTAIDISPMVGYRFSEKFIGGIGGTYFFYQYKGNGFNIQSSLYGGRVFAQYLVIPQAFLYTEQEMMTTQYYDQVDQTIKQKLLFNPLVGAGYRQSIGDRSGVNLMVLYNLNFQPNYSIYSSPWVVRVGFLF
jgi:hypothetical protein